MDQVGNTLVRFFVEYVESGSVMPRFAEKKKEKLVWKYRDVSLLRTVIYYVANAFLALKWPFIQWCRRVKKVGGASSKGWAESAHPGWNRVKS